MSSNERLSDTTDEESTFSFSNLTKLKPYDFEPLASYSSSSLSSGKNSDTNPDNSGSTAWCIETNEIPDLIND